MKKHLVIATLLTAFLFSASCLKKTNLEEEDLGIAVAPEQVSAALGEGFGTINYSDIKVNDKSSIVLTQTLQDGAPQPIQQQDVTITSVNNNSSSLQLGLTVKTISYSGSGGTTEENQTLTKNFTKYSGYAFADDNSDNTLFLFQTLQNLALGSCSNEGNYPETCHNLVSTDISYRVPPASATQHPSCTDIYNCYIPAKKVEFDLIRLYEVESDGKPRRIHYTFVLSPHVPFTSKVLQYCTRSLYDIEGASQKVLADLCYGVNNYTFGN